MSREANKQLMRDFFAAFSGKPKPQAALAGYVADAGLLAHIQAFERAFPCYEMIAEDLVAEGDKVVVRATVRGTHQGELMGLPPTGRHAAVSVIVIYRLAGGKVVEHWLASDQRELLRQLRVISA